jgi:predicted nucleic acid-binding protein
MSRTRTLNFLLDSCILGQLCHPRAEENPAAMEWYRSCISRKTVEIRLIVPEIADYELRRELLRIALKNKQPTSKSLERLNRIAEDLDYLPLSTGTMKRAAELWARNRAKGRPGASDKALDGDVILAAQAIEVGGVVITSNTRHFHGIVDAMDLEAPLPS